MAKKTEQKNMGMQILKQQLKSGEFAPLYFFYGEERYLQEYYLSALKKKVVSGPMEEFNFRRLTSENFSMAELRDAVESLPMMADYTMVQVDDLNPFAMDEEHRNGFIEIFSDLPDTCVLVFYFDTVEYRPDGKMKKLLAAVEENATLVEFQKQSPAELADWVARHFRAQNKNISPDLCQHLIFLSGGDMTTLASEITKVAAYSRTENITRVEIDTVVEPVLSAVLFDITDALAEKNYGKSLLRLQALIQSKEDPIVILSAIGGHFRKLLSAKIVMASGKGMEALMSLLGTNSDFYCNKILGQSKRVTEAFCEKAILLCYEADRKMKSSYGEETRILEMLLLTLAQEESR